MKHDRGDSTIQGTQRRVRPSQHTFADVSLWWRLRRHHIVAPTRRVPRRPVHPPRARTLEWPPPCASISIYVCIYTCIHIYICIYTYMVIDMYICRRPLGLQMHSITITASSCGRSLVYMYINIQTDLVIHGYICTYTYTHTNTCIHRTHGHIYIHTYMYVCVCKRVCAPGWTDEYYLSSFT